MTESTLHSVTGTLFYRERIALPPDAMMSVEIVYVPAEGASPVAIGYSGFQAAGRQVPVEFEVPYDDSEIDGRRNYYISARIDHGSPQFRFASTEPVPVITHDHPTREVNVMMRQAPREGHAAVVTGTVIYFERMMLRPDYVLTVRLQDVSRADAPASTLGEQTYATQGRQAPLPFTIEYDPSDIDPRFSYSISARIEDREGNLRMISDTSNPVITRDNPSENIEVKVRSI